MMKKKRRAAKVNIKNRSARSGTEMRDLIWDLLKLAERIKPKPMGWSADDEAIYDHNYKSSKFRIVKQVFAPGGWLRWL